MQPARTPRILWVELTSKCPFDCVFCSRKARRGAGEHMPFALFTTLVAQVVDPRKFLLNYSGESTVYPELIPAIRLARSTGAAVELVSALANAGDTLIDELTASGLTRLTVSVHATDPVAFGRIYRHGTFEALGAKLQRAVERRGPAVDLAFVAMRQNLAELAGVARMASELGIAAISIFPVIRRDAIAAEFEDELTARGSHREAFRAALNRAIGEAAAEHPGIAFHVCNPAFTSEHAPLGETPAPCPGDLPAGARIHSCEQNPWETAHILSNGDVVACEVHDRTPLGNLARQSLAEIWNGGEYSRFRRSYQSGAIAECRTCPWKSAHRPAPLRSDILAERGRNAQLWHGWHEPRGEKHVWASQQAVAVIEPRAGSDTLQVKGVLPPGPGGAVNRLNISCNGTTIGQVANPSEEPLQFGADFAVPPDAGRPWTVEFRSSHVCRPVERGTGADQRDLGFALHVLAGRPASDPDLVHSRTKRLRHLVSAIHAIDRLGRISPASGVRRPRRFAPGLSVIVPERGNAEQLARCLDALAGAREGWSEPIEVLVVVNGSAPLDYRDLQARHRDAQWQFHPQPLGFAGAVAAGLRRARHDWVYLLNSDAFLEPDALLAAGRLRGPGVFSIASQIVLEDLTRFRDETNWTTLFLEDGVVTTHDLIPDFGEPREHFYSGGGASMFQRRLLGKVIDTQAYHPFYWEDVEWGWRARKLGCVSLFCPSSVATHSQRATISRYYSGAEIETIVERNRYLFQFRNLLTAGSLDAAVAAVAHAEGAVAKYFMNWRALGRIASGRLWNHRAAVPDEEVLALPSGA